MSKAKYRDRTILVAWSEKQNNCACKTSGALRGKDPDQLEAHFFSGEAVHTYLGFISQNGKSIASSVYTGLITVS